MFLTWTLGTYLRALAEFYTKPQCPRRDATSRTPAHGFCVKRQRDLLVHRDIVTPSATRGFHSSKTPPAPLNLRSRFPVAPAQSARHGSEHTAKTPLRSACTNRTQRKQSFVVTCFRISSSDKNGSHQVPVRCQPPCCQPPCCRIFANYPGTFSRQVDIGTLTLLRFSGSISRRQGRNRNDRATEPEWHRQPAR